MRGHLLHYFFLGVALLSIVCGALFHHRLLTLAVVDVNTDTDLQSAIVTVAICLENLADIYSECGSNPFDHNL
jgi:hypothetical protein